MKIHHACCYHDLRGSVSRGFPEGLGSENIEKVTRVVLYEAWCHGLLPILEVVRLQEGSDHRDKLYAAFGITLESSDSAFKADYAASVPEVYSKFVIDFISRTGSVDVF